MRTDGVIVELDRLTIAGLELFSGLGDAEVDQILALIDQVQLFEAGAVLCGEGSIADTWWIVLEGDADVTIGDVFVGAVGEGETVGELAALDENVRSATVTARTALQVAAIATARFDELLDVAPSITKLLLRQMSARLRTASSAAAEPSAGPHLIAALPETIIDAPGPPAEFSPLDPAFFEDRYAAYAALRRDGPVYNEVIESWIVGGYDDVARLMRDRETSSDMSVATPNDFTAASEQFNQEIGDPQTMSRLDGDHHRRVRRLVTSAFTPRSMRKISDRIESRAIQLLEAAAAKGPVDFVETVALPLPSAVISDLLGVPAADVPRLHHLSQTASRISEPLVSPEEHAGIKTAVQELRAYMLDLLEAKRADPQDDLLSALAFARDGDDHLTRLEIVDNAGLMYIAGHLTTVFLLTSTVAAIWDHPDQLARLRQDPTLVPNAIEEVLRYEAPTQFGRRFAVHDIELSGQAIPAGAAIVTGIGAANRDPAHWGDDAHVFRVDRAGAHRHLSFAAGAHFCVGAALARMEAEIVLRQLLQRWPTLRITNAERPWSVAFVLNGLDRLTVDLNG